MSVEIPTIQTGIYRHFKLGALYFVEGLEMDTDSNSTKFRVRYTALYPESSFPFSRSLSNFKDKKVGPERRFVERFALVQALPVEKMQMLLPGTMVQWPCADRIKKLRVESLTETENGILVKLNGPKGDISVFLSEFLTKSRKCAD
jgi:hypothetical protein